jgi:UDP-N-acetylmuramyl pentapeptide phosphotransferase/UDP-N-acetylglucosamine-1-phosphate transferase
VTDESLLSMIIAAVATFLITFTLTPALAAWARRRDLMDVPNERSSHVVATPRIGGVAVVLGTLAGVLLLFVLGDALQRATLVVLAGALFIAMLGLSDDLLQLPAVLRLIVQILVAALVVYAAGPSPLAGWEGDALVAYAAMVIWLVAVTNAYNFMDGIDGIAGGQAIVAATAWLIVGMLSNEWDPATLGSLLAAASAAFLLHNWHPARVFMGDAGSGFFGFLFAALPMTVPAARPAAIGAAALLLWPFLFDTAFTLIRRARRGENVLVAHRSHLYQRLVQTGRSHRYVAALYAGLALPGAVGAVAAVDGNDFLLLAACVCIAVAAAVLWRVVATRERAALMRAAAR